MWTLDSNQQVGQSQKEKKVIASNRMRSAEWRCAVLDDTYSTGGLTPSQTRS